MSADLDELMLVSCLCPELVWSASSTQPVIVASDETDCTGCQCRCGRIHVALYCLLPSSTVMAK